MNAVLSSIVRVASLTLVAWLLAMPGRSDAGEPPKGFRDLLLGARPNGALKKKAGRPDQVEIYVPRSKKLQPLFELPVTEEAYLFTQGRFYSGIARIAGRANFHNIATALTGALGEPSYPSERPDVLKWTWPRSSIEVELSYDRNSSKSTVTFVNTAI
jgi:hypothetical protein